MDWPRRLSSSRFDPCALISQLMSRVGWNSRVPRAAQLLTLLTQGASPSGILEMLGIKVGSPWLPVATGSPQIDQGGSVSNLPSALNWGPFGTGTRSTIAGAL